ncbi:MAG: Rieske 2Fe-2S domain-containing protein, partial [Acholeplasmataceae bacterium]|nr:Rieske 2Fe-2S domain-containing protein [Acholeplasmataceae bacterium]
MEYYATDYHELKKSFKKRVEIEKIPILLICLEDNVYAIHDKCPHLGASLDKGDYKDGAVRCKAHGATIDVKTGEIR